MVAILDRLKKNCRVIIKLRHLLNMPIYFHAKNHACIQDIPVNSQIDGGYYRKKLPENALKYIFYVKQVLLDMDHTSRIDFMW